MCGIAGIYNFDGAPASPVTVKAMTEAIAHRGPDGEGQFTDGPVALGHRRLSIIDLSDAAHQPMPSADGRLVITYNGEVYNFQELRIDLEAKGHAFRSRGDSEVLVTALREWGDAAVSKFNGMFAFAAWDRVGRRLVLGRDRLGIKPLYWAKVGQRVLLGSELKALRAADGWQPQVDRGAVAGGVVTGVVTGEDATLSTTSATGASA